MPWVSYQIPFRNRCDYLCMSLFELDLVNKRGPSEFLEIRRCRMIFPAPVEQYRNRGKSNTEIVLES